MRFIRYLFAHWLARFFGVTAEFDGHTFGKAADLPVTKDAQKQAEKILG